MAHVVYGETFTVDAGTAQVLGSYGYCSNGYGSSSQPLGWTLVGSNDNSSWYWLDTVTNGNAGCGSSDAQTFVPQGMYASTPYRYYRWCLERCDQSFYVGGFFFKNTSNNIITCTVVQCNIVVTNNGNPYMVLSTLINFDTFQSGQEDILVNYGAGVQYLGNNSTTLTGFNTAPIEINAETFTVDLGTSQRIGSYGYCAGTHTTDIPSKWVIGGSNDATTWYLVDSVRQGATGSGDARSFTPSGPFASSAFRYYIWSMVSANNSGLFVGGYFFNNTSGSMITCSVTQCNIQVGGETGGVTYDVASLINNNTYISGFEAYLWNYPQGNYNGNNITSFVQVGLPSPPTSLSWIDLYNGHISVSFTEGDSGGSSIINYSYSLDNGTTFTEFDPAQTTSPILITGLTNRTNYNLQLKAHNSLGISSSSSNLALYYMCFLEGTKILCFNEETQEEEERAIETLKKGDLVKTYSNGYKPIDTIGTSKIYNPSNSMRSLNRLYRCPMENYPSLKEDLVITGCHSILVKDITEEERGTLLELQGKIYVTEKNYRLIAAADMKAVPYEQEGFFNIWHFALEHPKYTFNYGVYANGLLVECSSMRMMRELSGMDLME